MPGIPVGKTADRNTSSAGAARGNREGVQEQLLAAVPHHWLCPLFHAQELQEEPGFDPAWHSCTAQHWRSFPKEFGEQTFPEPHKDRKPQVSAVWLLPNFLLEVLELPRVAEQRAGDNLIGDCTKKSHPNSSIQPHSLHTLSLPGTAFCSCCWLGCAPWKHYHHFSWKDEAEEVWDLLLHFLPGYAWLWGHL